MIEMIQKSIEQSIETKKKLLDISNEILKAGMLAADVLSTGNKILLCGNGGSAADAQHIAAELSIRYKGSNERMALPAMTLSGDPSTITACGNDYGFDKLFSRQVEAFGNKNDLLIGISTSGNSQNIIEAIQMARKKEMRVLLLLGKDGGKMKNQADIELIVPVQETARIQESHILIGHMLCAIIEKKLFNLD